MRMSHEEKVRIAKALRSRYDVVNHTPLFASNGWIRRKLAIMNKNQRSEVVVPFVAKESWWRRLLKWIKSIFYGKKEKQV